MNEPALFLDGRVSLYAGDCMEVLPSLRDYSVDSAVMDPPYHLTSIQKRFGSECAALAQEGATGAFKRASAGFMGKQWDGGDIAFRPDVWRECMRVLRPGGYLLAFASTRGFGRMSVAIEDAGFITHPLIAWVFGSGFPKATRIKAEGFDGQRYGGQALKPAIEPIYMGQKPFEAGLNGTDNILKHGTGAVNIDACRVEGNPAAWGNNTEGTGGYRLHKREERAVPSATGRWPANLIHDGSEEVLATFPMSDGSGPARSLNRAGGLRDGSWGMNAVDGSAVDLRDAGSGSAARFFYTAKADADDRLGSKHPTVKPLDLIQYLVRLITPRGGTVLDCFAGTGTTGEAAWREGCKAILIEREAEYLADIARRMDLADKPAKRTATAVTKNKLGGAEGTPLFGGEAA